MERDGEGRRDARGGWVRSAGTESEGERRKGGGEGCLRACQAPHAGGCRPLALHNGAAVGRLSFVRRLGKDERYPPHLEFLHVHDLLRLHLHAIESQLLWKRDLGLDRDDDGDRYDGGGFVERYHLRLCATKAVNPVLF